MKYDFIGTDKLVIMTKIGFGTKFIIRCVFIYQVRSETGLRWVTLALGLPYLLVNRAFTKRRVPSALHPTSSHLSSPPPQLGRGSYRVILVMRD